VWYPFTSSISSMRSIAVILVELTRLIQMKEQIVMSPCSGLFPIQYKPNLLANSFSRLSTKHIFFFSLSRLCRALLIRALALVKPHAQKMTKRVCDDDIPHLQPPKKKQTCSSLEGYMRMKEQQWLRNEVFICRPISFCRQVQDVQDPLSMEHVDTAHIFKLWEDLCLFAFTFPLWKHQADLNIYSRLIDELCDLIILQAKAASFSWSSTWEEWKEWDMFLLQYLANTTLLFHHCYCDCLQIVSLVDVHLFGIIAKLPLYSLPSLAPPIRNSPPYFDRHTYENSFPNFNVLTTR
jgi:hypothetical protein